MKITPFSTALKLTFRGKWVVRIITILLSAFSFTLFAIASMGFTFNRDNFFFRAYRNYLGEHSYLLFYNDDSKADNKLSQDNVALIEEKTSLNFISACEGSIDISEYVDSFFFRGEKYDENGLYTPEYKEFLEEKTKHFVFEDTCVLIGEESDFTESGVELLAGKYPEAENEIAIGKEFYDLFVWGGYSNNFDHYRERLVENDTEDEEPETQYYFDYELESNEREEIASYSDLIGKKLSSWEYTQLSGIYLNMIPSEVVIAGIVDTGGAGEWNYKFRSDRGFFTNVVIRSESWRQKQMATENLKTEGMLAPLPLTDNQIKECIGVTKELYESALLRNESTMQHTSAIGAYGYVELMTVNTGVDFLYVVLIFCGAGIIFLIFSIVLNAYLMTAMMNAKQKQIGILRALGAGNRQVSSYFLIGALLLSAVIFLTAIAMSVIIYFSWLVPWATLKNYGVCLFVYNGWTVLILAGISFVVPILSVLLPLRLFLRRSCVEMIKDTKAKRK